MTHIHVSSNVPGYSPENDVYCVDSSLDAARCVRAEVVQLGEFVLDGCDRNGCRICVWCRAGTAILADNTAQFESRVANELYDGIWAAIYKVPCSLGQSIWAVTVDTDRSTCLDCAT